MDESPHQLKRQRRLQSRKYTDRHTSDITYYTSDGTTYVGEEAWRFRVEELNRFTGRINDQASQLYVCWDEEVGYALVVLGSVHGRFQVLQGTVKDDEGSVYGRFQVVQGTVKDDVGGPGLRGCRRRIIADSRRVRAGRRGFC